MNIFKRAWNFIIGGPAETGIKIADGVADIVERFKPGEGKQHEMTMEINRLVLESQKSAREMLMGNTGTWFDSLINGVNRSIRPGLTIYYTGGFMGHWALPDVSKHDPVNIDTYLVIISFYFGGRMLFKDVPQLITYIKAMRKV